MTTLQNRLNGALVEVLERDERKSPAYPRGLVLVRYLAGRMAGKDYWADPADLCAVGAR